MAKNRLFWAKIKGVKAATEEQKGQKNESNWASSLAAFMTVAMPMRTRPTALLALQCTFLNRLRLMNLLAVVVLLIALAFAFGSTCITEPMSRCNLPATVANRLCHRLGLRGLGRPAKTKRIIQIKAVLFVFVPAPVLFAYLPAYPFMSAIYSFSVLWVWISALILVLTCSGSAGHACISRAKSGCFCTICAKQDAKTGVPEFVSVLFCKLLHFLCAGFKIPSWQQGEGSSPSFGIFYYSYLFQRRESAADFFQKTLIKTDE